MHLNVLRNWSKYRIKGMLSATKHVLSGNTLTEVETDQMIIIQITLEGVLENWVKKLEAEV